MTLPTVDQVLQAVQNCIRDDLWPETGSAWATRQARTALWALDHVRARLARGRELLDTERAQLLELVDALGELRANGGSAAAVVAAIQVPSVVGGPTSTRPLEQVEAEVLALRATAEQLAEVSADLTSAEQQPVRRALMRYLHDQDRRLEAVVSVEHTC